MIKHRLTDKPVPANIEALRHIDPTMPDWTWRIISNYEPRLSVTQWEATREFVITCVLSMKPRTFDNARRLMTMTSRYVAWWWARNGGELSISAVFAENDRRLYLSEVLPKHSSIYRWGVQRQLIELEESIKPRRADLIRFGTHKEHQAPYTAKELATLLSWANGLTTILKRRNAWALLGACGGAGLSAAELIAAQVEDVTVDEGVMFVKVRGDKARLVPVTEPWNRILARSLEGRETGDLFHGIRIREYPPRVLQLFLTDHPCQPRPSAARLNCGWLVALLDAAIPVPLLLQLAGMSSASGLQRYLSHAKPAALATHLSQITSAVTR
jgi:integrase